MRPLRVLFGSPASEKLLHQRPAFLFQNARADLNSMIQKICVADLKATYHCACAFIRRAVNQTPYARLYQSSCAHRARFDRRVNVDARQPVIAQRSRGLAQGDDFSVGRGIAVSTRAIPGNGDEFVFADNTSADGHFAASLCFTSGGQSVPHPVLINLCFQRTATIGRAWKQCQEVELPIADCQLPIKREPKLIKIGNRQSAIGNRQRTKSAIGNRKMLLSVSGVPRPTLPGALH